MKSIKIILLFMLLIAIPIIGAEKISEKSFSELGYADYSIDKGISSCENYTITGIETNVDATYVLQLKISNYELMICIATERYDTTVNQFVIRNS